MKDIIKLGLILFLLANFAYGSTQEPQSGSIPIKSNSATLYFSLRSSGECAENPAIAWLSKGKTLLYQADVSPNGTFEFHTRPGEFDISVTGKSGCYIEKTFTVKAEETKEITLNLDQIKPPSNEGANQ